MENKILPTGHFQLSDWIFTVNHICKRFSLYFILVNHLILHKIMSRMWKRCVQRPENTMRYVNSRTQHADVPTPPHHSLLTAQKPVLMFICLISKEICGHLSYLRNLCAIVKRRTLNECRDVVQRPRFLLTQIPPIPPPLTTHHSPLYNIIMYRENKSSFELH